MASARRMRLSRARRAAASARGSSSSRRQPPVRIAGGPWHVRQRTNRRFYRPRLPRPPLEPESEVASLLRTRRVPSASVRPRRGLRLRPSGRPPRHWRRRRSRICPFLANHINRGDVFGPLLRKLLGERFHPGEPLLRAQLLALVRVRRHEPGHGPPMVGDLEHPSAFPHMMDVPAGVLVELPQAHTVLGHHLLPLLLPHPMIRPFGDVSGVGGRCWWFSRLRRDLRPYLAVHSSEEARRCF